MWRTEQYFPVVPIFQNVRTTLWGIPKISKLFSQIYPFHSMFLPEISGIVQFISILSPQKVFLFLFISILPPQKVFCFAPLPLPPGNSSLFSYISSKNLAFKNPLSLRISSDLPWGGYGFFLEPHIFPWFCWLLSKLFQNHHLVDLLILFSSKNYISFYYFHFTPSMKYENKNVYLYFFPQGEHWLNLDWIEFHFKKATKNKLLQLDITLHELISKQKNCDE